MLTILDLKEKLSWEDSKVWIVGKGPSLKYLADFKSQMNHVIAINHACGHFQSGVALFTDLEALLDCKDYLENESAINVLIPNTPHVGNRPTDKTILDLRDRHPIVDHLLKEGRIFVYQSSNTKTVRNIGPTIELRFFSAEPAYQAACFLGASEVVTMGIDGGALYDPNLSEIARSRRLTNGRSSFDSQWAQLEKLKKRHKINMQNSINYEKIFVGVAERELVAFKVLEYSIHKYSSIPVQVIALPKVDINPRKRNNRARTPFSFSRFLIPQLMNYQGRAVYLDSDMVVFSDVAELFSYPMGNNTIAVTRQDSIPEKWKNNSHFSIGRQFSVMVIDCSKALWKIKEIIRGLDEERFTYEQLLFSLSIEDSSNISDALDPAWNMLEEFAPDKTKLLHFTVVPTQPWKDITHVLFPVWLQMFREAYINGYVQHSLVQKSVRRGHIDSSLLDEAIALFKLNPEGNRKEKGSQVQIEGSLITDFRYRLFAIVRNFRWRTIAKLRRVLA